MNLTKSQPLTIEGITNQVIFQYFDTLNRGDFVATARLFAPEGSLIPPFESPICGRDEISAYLSTEATGMKLEPRQGILQSQADHQSQYYITGKVKTSLFGVNVAWTFLINSKEEILLVEVKLLASPEELLNLRT